jgi:hypothetical protein
MCGRVTMRISAAPVMSMACHCRGCQKLTGGAYSLSLMVAADAFEVEGETEIGALHRPENGYFYCAYCKNWLYTDGIAGGQFVNFRPTLLDDANWVIPFIESNVAEKLPGVVSGAQHSFDGFPAPDQYGPLMEVYGKEGARPG